MTEDDNTARFWSNVQIGSTDDCWRWLGQETNGYGRFSAGGRTHHTSVFSFELANGPIEQGQKIGHSCGTRECVNPKHLHIVTMETRFWSKVDKRGPNDCWPWTGVKNWCGYGVFTNNNRLHKAHRVAWELANGEPLGQRLGTHRCDNPPCVNPSHIVPGTPLSNAHEAWDRKRMRGYFAENAAKTHCKHGHPLSGENVILRIRGRARRQTRECRECRDTRDKIRRAAARKSWGKL